ncbi:type II toxin-antitoxin system RelE/ParE family toxin [Roseivirga sp. BDSF3-8]|uniref:type II toxin-antitoxin system RelE/ParE family toxin n=1 Tax=Roseivirga sp. BDSF3-8 TaxID=3241598 RepID=UPI0035321575
MVYKISREASRDMENIWTYTFKNWSTEQADRYLNLIMDEIEYLAYNPQAGIDYSHIREGYFRSRVKSHFIFYRINEQEEPIEIIRVLHQQMDISSRLNE